MFNSGELGKYHICLILIVRENFINIDKGVYGTCTKLCSEQLHSLEKAKDKLIMVIGFSYNRMQRPSALLHAM